MRGTDIPDLLTTFLLLCGRFYGNHRGRYVHSRPILEVGVEEALAEVEYEVQRLIARGGLYLWRR